MPTWELTLATVIVGLYCLGSLVVAALLTWHN
jgi:hypothetical protein